MKKLLILCIILFLNSKIIIAEVDNGGFIIKDDRRKEKISDAPEPIKHLAEPSVSAPKAVEILRHMKNPPDREKPKDLIVQVLNHFIALYSSKENETKEVSSDYLFGFIQALEFADRFLGQKIN